MCKSRRAPVHDFSCFEVDRREFYCLETIFLRYIYRSIAI